MTCEEFSREFDILYNNIMSNQAPGLNEYEKSVFLTQAQEQVIREIYNGKQGFSFEVTEEMTAYIKSLVTQVEITAKDTTKAGINKNSVFFTLPDDLLFITYESAVYEDESLCGGDQEATIVPITQDSYSKTIRDPFRGPNINRVLRLSMGNQVELISNYDIKSYKVRYIAKPVPIVLADLSAYGVSIDNVDSTTECSLHSMMHRPILIQATQTAKMVWYTNNGN